MSTLKQVRKVVGKSLLAASLLGSTGAVAETQAQAQQQEQEQKQKQTTKIDIDNNSGGTSNVLETAATGAGLGVLAANMTGKSTSVENSEYCKTENWSQSVLFNFYTTAGSDTVYAPVIEVQPAKFKTVTENNTTLTVFDGLDEEAESIKITMQDFYKMKHSEDSMIRQVAQAYQKQMGDGALKYYQTCVEGAALTHEKDMEKLAVVTDAQKDVAKISAKGNVLQQNTQGFWNAAATTLKTNAKIEEEKIKAAAQLAEFGLKHNTAGGVQIKRVPIYESYDVNVTKTGDCNKTYTETEKRWKVVKDDQGRVQMQDKVIKVTSPHISKEHRGATGSQLTTLVNVVAKGSQTADQQQAAYNAMIQKNLEAFGAITNFSAQVFER